MMQHCGKDVLRVLCSLIFCSLNSKPTSIRKIIDNVERDPGGYLALDDGIIHVILNMVCYFNLPESLSDRIYIGFYEGSTRFAESREGNQ